MSASVHLTDRKMRTTLVCFAIFAIVAPASVLGISDETKKVIREHFEKIGLECLKDNPITEEDIHNLRSRKPTVGEKAPCFIACIFRHIGVIDDSGMVAKESALELARKEFDDEEELKSIENYLHVCQKVNEESVSDGDKGCDRAIKAYKCMIDNAAEFGMDV